MTISNSKRHKKKSCKHKIRHKTEDGAYTAIYHLKKRNFILHKMKVYKCRYCKGFHIARTKEIDYSQFDKLKEK